MKLAVTQIPVKNHQLTLVWKTLIKKKMKMMIIISSSSSSKQASVMWRKRWDSQSHKQQTSTKIVHDYVGKVIHWESCKGFKFGQTNKWYIHKPEYVRENEMHLILWDHQILVRRPHLAVINKKDNLSSSEFCRNARSTKWK